MNRNKVRLAALERDLSSRKTSHILHFLLSLITAGLWVPFWILIIIDNGIASIKLEGKIEKIYAELRR